MGIEAEHLAQRVRRLESVMEQLKKVNVERAAELEQLRRAWQAAYDLSGAFTANAERHFDQKLLDRFFAEVFALEDTASGDKA